MPNRQLTRRQRECLEGQSRHMTAKEIGRQLNISHNTVHMHCRLARLKLQSLTVLAAAHDGSASGRETGGLPRQTDVQRGRFTWFDLAIHLMAIAMAVLTALMWIVLVTIVVIGLFGLRHLSPTTACSSSVGGANLGIHGRLSWTLICLSKGPDSCIRRFNRETGPGWSQSWVFGNQAD